MRKIIPYILLMGMVACIDNSSTDTNRQENDQAIADSLTVELNALWEDSRMIGFSVALLDENDILYENGFGYMDATTKEKFTEHTVQNIASISKTFIGMALLKAQELGKLHLDDPVNEYLPFEVVNPYYPDDKITVRQLATHTSSIIDTEFYYEKSYILKEEASSSIPNQGEVGVIFNPPDSAMSMIDYLEKVLTSDGKWYTREGFLQKIPGELYAYSNVAATLAAAVLETATGESFDRFTMKHIFQPLHMNASGWSFSTIDLSRHTKLFLEHDKEIPLYSLITYPDGGLITSAHDLSIYLSELIKGYFGKGTILNNSSYNELFKPQLNVDHFLNPDESNEFNEGIFMSLLTNGFIGHSGGDPGVSTFMYFKPGTRTGRILLVNTELDSLGEKQFYSIVHILGLYEQKFKPSSESE